MRGARWIVSLCLLVPLPLGAQASQHWSENRAPTFEDFPVEANFAGPSVPIDLSSHAQGWTYRTRLRRAAEQPPDFAGHYVVAQWGCGTSCAVHHLVDLTTGRIFDAPSAGRGFLHRVESRLIIQDPPISGFAYRTASDLSPVVYWLWKDETFVRIYQEDCTVVDRKQTCKAE